MSDLVLNFRDIDLYSRDIALFTDGQWLNDTCINFCVNKKLHDSNIENVIFMDPSIVSFMMFQVEDEDEMQELSDGLQIGLKDWVLVPINDCEALGSASNHWSLLVCHIQSGYLGHLDSSKHNNLKSAQRVAMKLSELLKRPLKGIMPLSTPQQQNGYDCGVYTILYAYNIIDAVVEVDESPQDTAQRAIGTMNRALTPIAVTEYRLSCMLEIKKLSDTFLATKVLI